MPTGSKWVAGRRRPCRTGAGPRLTTGPFCRLGQQLEQVPGGHGGPGEVREHAVDPEPVELQVLLERVVAVVAQKAPFLVTERPRVDLQPPRVRPLDEIGR